MKDVVSKLCFIAHRLDLPFCQHLPLVSNKVNLTNLVAQQTTGNKPLTVQFILAPRSRCRRQYVVRNAGAESDGRSCHWVTGYTFM